MGTTFAQRAVGPGVENPVDTGGHILLLVFGNILFESSFDSNLGWGGGSLFVSRI